LAAIIGGYVCVTIARRPKAARWMASVVVALGLLMAIPALLAQPSNKVRTGDVPNMEAMMNGQQPTWVALANPLVGGAGVLIGAGLRKQKPI
jgi:hypothetical protein